MKTHLHLLLASAMLVACAVSRGLAVAGTPADGDPAARAPDAPPASDAGTADPSALWEDAPEPEPENPSQPMPDDPPQPSPDKPDAPAETAPPDPPSQPMEESKPDDPQKPEPAQPGKARKPKKRRTDAPAPGRPPKTKPPAAEEKPEADAPMPEPSDQPVEPPVEPPVETPDEPVVEAAPKPWELSASFETVLAQNEMWKSAQGVGFDLTYWQWAPWGIGAFISATSWDLESGELDLPYALRYTMVAEGSASIRQFGVLGAYRHEFGRGFEAVARAGVSYLYTDTSILVTTDFVNHYNQDVSHSLHARSVSHVMGRAGIAVRYTARLNRIPVVSHVGMDYQGSLSGDDFGWLREMIGADFNALTLRIGAGVAF